MISLRGEKKIRLYANDMLWYGGKNPIKYAMKWWWKAQLVIHKSVYESNDMMREKKNKWKELWDIWWKNAVNEI